MIVIACCRGAQTEKDRRVIQLLALAPCRTCGQGVRASVRKCVLRICWFVCGKRVEQHWVCELKLATASYASHSLYTGPRPTFHPPSPNTLPRLPLPTCPRSPALSRVLWRGCKYRHLRKARRRRVPMVTVHVLTFGGKGTRERAKLSEGRARQEESAGRRKEST